MSMSQTSTTNLPEDDVAAPVLLSPMALTWRKFKRHRIAYYSLFIVAFIYLMALVGEFMTPADIHKTSTRRAFAPPQGIHLFAPTESGGTEFKLHARDLKLEIDRKAMRRIFV